jgi:hypothetical protein
MKKMKNNYNGVQIRHILLSYLRYYVHLLWGWKSRDFHIAAFEVRQLNHVELHRYLHYMHRLEQVAVDSMISGDTSLCNCLNFRHLYEAGHFLPHWYNLMKQNMIDSCSRIC